MSDVERLDENLQDVIRAESRRLDGTITVCAVLLFVAVVIEAAKLIVELAG